MNVYLILGAVLTSLVLLIASFMMVRKIKYREKRAIGGHVWVEVPLGGPVEEGGVCKYCGAWATSEQDTICDQHR